MTTFAVQPITAARLREIKQTTGYRTHTVARSTSTTVILVDGYLQGLTTPDQSDGRWWLICDEHGGCVGFENQEDARSFLSHPENWCPTCQGFEDPANERKQP